MTKRFNAAQISVAIYCDVRSAFLQVWGEHHAVKALNEECLHRSRWQRYELRDYDRLPLDGGPRAGGLHVWVSASARCQPSEAIGLALWFDEHVDGAALSIDLTAQAAQRYPGIQPRGGPTDR